jgi:mannose-6-phosphate isomerase-like protein (cupin superfamily)
VTKRITDSPEVNAFRETASRFVELVDGRADYEVADFLRRIQPELARLVATAMELPAVERGGPMELAEFTHEESASLRQSLHVYVERYDFYSEVFDPYVPEEPIGGSLSDALETVYSGLFPGMSSWDASSAGGRRTAIWDWQWKFEYIWGHHAIDAMRAIHSLLFTHDLGEPFADWPPARGESAEELPLAQVRVQTSSLPEKPQDRSPAGAEIRFLMSGATGDMIHSTVPPGQVNRATVHATVSEFWHVLSGEGQIWRRNDSGDEVTDLCAGVSINIPVGTAFQYRCTGTDPLRFICITMPPWPGHAEATIIEGPWEPNAPEGWPAEG